MNSSAPAVVVEALWKRFGYRTALSGVHLTVASGQCLAIFGPNGAGKSTLLRILATRVRPTSGRAEVLGFDLHRQAIEVRQRIGVVFHDSCLRGDLTLEENLRFYGSLYGKKRLSDDVERLIELLDLGDRRRDLVRNFSRGMSQRATLIRSLIHDPSVWLLDEPLSGLDPEGQSLLGAVMREETERGRTVIFVTHNVEAGLAIADDAIVVQRGDIVARGTGAIRGHYESPLADMSPSSQEDRGV